MSTERSATWEERLTHLQGPLLGRAQALLGRRFYGAGAPDAADLMQQVILRLRPQEDHWADKSDALLAGYALRAVHNLYIDKCHRKRREMLSAEGDPVEPVSGAESSPEQQVIARQEREHYRERLREVLEDLNDDERRFLLASLSMSAAEAQRELGYPPGTPSNAAQKRKSLLKRLRKRLAAQEEDDA